MSATAITRSIIKLCSAPSKARARSSSVGNYVMAGVLVGRNRAIRA
jgi:hypothetical protein